MSDKESWRNIGQQVRTLRKENQLTLKQLAKGSGLSANSISLVERGEVAPTVATLCKIAHALGVPAGLLFQEACPPPADSEDGLGSCCWQADLPAGPAAPVQTVVCLSGSLRCQVQERAHTLKAGETLTLTSGAACRWINAGATPGVALLVLAPDETLFEDFGEVR